jgi:hypothetical protein
MRWDRAAHPETLREQSGPISAIDLSADGTRVVALVGQDSLWIGDGTQPPRDRILTPPAGYMAIASPRCIDPSRVLVGGLGPEGYGLWTWDLEGNRFDPVCTRFANGTDARWYGISGGIDRSETFFCMETESRVSILGRLSDCRLLRALDGSAPAFWMIDPAEQDGLLYLDLSNTLIGERPATGERFALLGSTFAFDVTADGRWVLAQVSRPDGRRLVLLHLREPR